MSKDRSFTLRIRDAELKYLTDNLPDEIPSVSELLRKGGRALVEGIEGQSHVLDTTVISELLNEVQDRIIREIHISRSFLMNIFQALENQKVLKQNQVKKISIKQILETWLSDIGKLKSYNHVEDLEESIEYHHLKKYGLDAIKELVDRGLLLVRPGGGLRWSIDD